jgi:hypothetical protein
MQPQWFRNRIMALLPTGSQVTLTGGKEADILFHTENLDHELTGLRVKFDGGVTLDVQYSEVLSPEWGEAMREEQRMGRPSQGRSVRLQAAITPEQMAWLEEQRIERGEKSISDVVFKLLGDLVSK